MVLNGFNGTQQFENDVKMYGTQAATLNPFPSILFENDVKMYGTQAHVFIRPVIERFENDVKMYGTQAMTYCHTLHSCLRMM